MSDKNRKDSETSLPDMREMFEHYTSVEDDEKPAEQNEMEKIAHKYRKRSGRSPSAFPTPRTGRLRIFPSPMISRPQSRSRTMFISLFRPTI